MYKPPLYNCSIELVYNQNNCDYILNQVTIGYDSEDELQALIDQFNNNQNNAKWRIQEKNNSRKIFK